MSSFPEYDSDNRFMRCAMEHKMNSGSFSSIPSVAPSSITYDIDNRFEALRYNIYTPNKNEITLEKVSIKNNRELRSNSCSSIFSNSSTSSQKYPNSRLRSSSNQDVRKSSQDVFEENFPCLNSTPILSPSSIKTPLTPITPLTSPITPISYKKVLDPNGTVKLSVQGGKVIKEELYTMVPEEPPPLVITPSKWSDLFYTTNN
jgi:hypothetical protein